MVAMLVLRIGKMICCVTVFIEHPLIG